MTGAANRSEDDSHVLSDEQRENRVLSAVREYQAAIDAGGRPSRDEYVARHAEIAEPLAECLEAIDYIRDAGPRLNDSSASRAARGAASPIDLLAPLGDFRIVREIGRGGMGVVYEAEQLSLGRRIALKVLPFAWTLDPRQLQRFKNEARAAAQLHHSHIVPVYSVGCERGVHFYAMQYIEGQTLAEAIRTLCGRGIGEREPDSESESESGPKSASRAADPTVRAECDDTLANTGPLATVPSSRSPRFFRTIAEFGVQASEALDHAHQYGVVHRDIKPGNLLLDVAGHLWVTDFGLAQFPSDTMLTMSGDLLGTLRYMSPEQALAKRGLIDHRTDVYSLGVTLYELLTLKPAYDGADREELLRQITFEEPRPPRHFNPAIPIDLETIVLKAMAKRLEDRYASARDLADDLRRYLEQKPIRARRPSLVERSAHWARRHKLLVASSVVLLLLTSIGFAISTALIARAQWNTQAAYAAAREQRDMAQKSFLQARDVVDRFTEMSEEELRDRPELQSLRRKMLQSSLAYYQDFIDQRKDDPWLAAELAASHLRVANILDEIGTRLEAQAAMERARRFQEQLTRDHPTNSVFQQGLTSIEAFASWRRASDQCRLLAMPTVQSELKLNADQTGRLDLLAAQRRESYRDFRRMTPDEWRLKAEEGAAIAREMTELLAPEQTTRLKQIIWQQHGAHALTDPEVADSLRLTAEQREKMRGIDESARDAIRRSFASRGGHPPGPPRKGFEKDKPFDRSPDKASERAPEPRGAPPRIPAPRGPDDLFQRTRQQLFDTLTPEQQTQWLLLLGAPFDAAR